MGLFISFVILVFILERAGTSPASDFRYCHVYTTINDQSQLDQFIQNLSKLGCDLFNDVRYKKI